MALPKSVAQTSVDSTAYLRVSIDVASVGANSSLDTQIAAPKAFRYDRPVLVALEKAETVLNAGLVLQPIARVLSNSGKKIEFRIGNCTAGALDPTARVFVFWQL